MAIREMKTSAAAVLKSIVERKLQRIEHAVDGFDRTLGVVTAPNPTEAPVSVGMPSAPPA